MTILPAPDRVTRTPDDWFVWVAVPGPVVWGHRGIRGACEPRNLQLVITPTEEATRP